MQDHAHKKHIQTYAFLRIRWTVCLFRQKKSWLEWPHLRALVRRKKAVGCFFCVRWRAVHVEASDGCVCVCENGQIQLTLTQNGSHWTYTRCFVILYMALDGAQFWWNISSMSKCIKIKNDPFYGHKSETQECVSFFVGIRLDKEFFCVWVRYTQNTAKWISCRLCRLMNLLSKKLATDKIV